MWSQRQLGLFVLAGSALVLTVVACRREETADAAADAAGKAKQEHAAAMLVFPNELRVDDASVNAFVTDAMSVCSSGEYAAFRLLWSAREEPLSRDEFEQGWQAVQVIRIRALERVKLAGNIEGDSAEPRIGYALYADVALDPAHKAAREKPQREVVLMIVREHDEWRLAGAPKSVREWMSDKVKRAAVDDQGPGTGRSTGQETG